MTGVQSFSRNQASWIFRLLRQGAGSKLPPFGTHYVRQRKIHLQRQGTALAPSPTPMLPPHWLPTLQLCTLLTPMMLSTRQFVRHIQTLQIFFACRTNGLRPWTQNGVPYCRLLPGSRARKLPNARNRCSGILPNEQNGCSVMLPNKRNGCSTTLSNKRNKNSNNLLL